MNPSLLDIKNLYLLRSACRTKNLNNQSNLNGLDKIKYKIKKILSYISFLKKYNFYKFINAQKNIFPYNLSTASVIPREFIRLDPWEMEYLYSVAKFAKKGIVELGRFNGGSTIVLSIANTKVKKYSIDIKPQDDDKCLRLLEQLNCNNNLNLIIGDSQKAKYDDIKSYDFLFVDGDHSYNGCLNDLNNWWDALESGGHVILHDCYLGNEVQEAAVDFLANKNVKIIIAPYRGLEHWHNRASGSLCHFIKL